MLKCHQTNGPHILVAIEILTWHVSPTHTAADLCCLCVSKDLWMNRGSHQDVIDRTQDQSVFAQQHFMIYFLMQKCDKMLEDYVHTPKYVPVIKQLTVFPRMKQPTCTLRLSGATIILTGSNRRGRCQTQIIKKSGVIEFDSCKLQTTVPAFFFFFFLNTHTHTHTHSHTYTCSNSSCRWSYIHIWQQLEL